METAIFLTSFTSHNTTLVALLQDLFVDIGLPVSHVPDFIPYLREYFKGTSDDIYFNGNDLYVVDKSKLSSLVIVVPSRRGNELLFPTTFLASHSLKPTKQLYQVLKYIGDVVVELFNINVGRDVIKYKVQDTFDRSDLVLYVSPETEITAQFERTRLGMFVYLLYLRDVMEGNPRACVIISQLKPLFDRARAIENALLTIDSRTFAIEYPSMADNYGKLISNFQEYSLPEFRYGLLSDIIDQSGPFITLDGVTGDLHVSGTFTKLLERCESRPATKLSVSFLIMKSPQIGAHANLIILDRDERTLERFEPNGSLENITLDDGDISPESVAFKRLSDLADRALTRYANSIRYKYISPLNFCPNIGVQSLENFFSTQSTGFCVSWSIIYGEERLTSKVSRSYIANNMIEDIITKYNLRGTSRETTVANIERWLRSRIDTIFTRMTPYYTVLSDYFGVSLVYKDNRLIYA